MYNLINTQNPGKPSQVALSFPSTQIKNQIPGPRRERKARAQISATPTPNSAAYKFKISGHYITSQTQQRNPKNPQV